jgi:uncharacterized protein (UPF0276 family)
MGLRSLLLLVVCVAASGCQGTKCCVSDPVWDLLDACYAHCGLRPTVLERDFNIPPLDVLLREIQRIREIQAKHRPPALTNGT